MKVGGCIHKDVAYLYERGLREKNQDAILFLSNHTADGVASIAAVFDGIGGLVEGENASGFCAKELSNWFYLEYMDLLKNRQSQGAIKRSMQRMLYKIHNKIKIYSKKNGIHMGTTASIIIIKNYKYMIFHYGDSRIYKLHRNARLLTVNQIDDDGNLTKCIGCGNYNKAYFKSGIILPGEGILLMSDGLTHFLSDKDYVSLIRKRTGNENLHNRNQKLLEALYIRAKQRGERDNCSGVYIQF